MKNVNVTFGDGVIDDLAKLGIDAEKEVNRAIGRQRIKQLLGQAYDEAVPETWTTLSSEQLGRVYEKFAELIVQECAKIADEPTSQPFDSYGLKIKEHFGVRE